MSTLVVRTGRSDVSLASFSAIARAIEGPELEVNVLEREAIVLGAYQRACEVKTDLPIASRASGGGAVRVGAGTIHVLLALPEPSSLAVDADPSRILNRYVRPLLKAVTKASIITSYFGRDWISTAHRPVGIVGFAHDSVTRRTVFEAFVATRTPFAVGEPRATFQGKEPATLDAIAGKPIDVAKLASSIVETYAAAWVLDVDRRPANDRPTIPESIAEPWLARVDEAIGPVFADRTHVGGEFMASSDAVGRVNAALAKAADATAVAHAIDLLGAPGVALEGIRSLHSLKNAVLQARGEQEEKR